MKSVFLTLLTCIVCSYASAQTPDVIETSNEYVRAEVLKRTGQFHIMTPEGYPLSYSGNGQWNSHTTFFLTASGSDVYYSNQIQKATPATKDMAGPMSQLLLPDSTYVIDDTIRTVWGNMRSFAVLQDVYPTRTSGGGLIVVKYSVAARDENTSNRFRGVFLMLDLQVQPPGSDQCSLDADKPIVLTNLMYNARPRDPGLGTGVCWTGVEHRYIDSTGIPDWYIAGRRFPDYGDASTLIGKGILRGPGLVPPTEFLVSDWGNPIIGLKDTTWNFIELVKQRDYTDAAVGYKWSMDIVGTSQPRVVATAYGRNDFGEKFSLCNNPLMLVSSVSPRHHYRGPDGRYDSLNTTVDVWAINADHVQRSTLQDTIILDLTGAPQIIRPSVMKKLPLIPGTTSSSLGTTNVGHTSFTLTLDTNKVQKGQDYDETFSFSITTSNIPLLNASCPMMITTTFHAGLPDITAPTIKVLSSTRITTQWEAADAGAGDSGLDSIIVVENTNYMFTPPFVLKCDPTFKAQLVVRVRDTTKDAKFVFQARDCEGNFTVDSVKFTAIHVGVADNSVAPENVAIESYPNPFTAGTDLEITGPATRLVSDVRVFSSIGADVTRSAIVNITDIGDMRRVHLDGRTLTPGLYTVVVGTPRGALRHNILLVR